jgi:hypothetical protein
MVTAMATSLSTRLVHFMPARFIGLLVALAVVAQPSSTEPQPEMGQAPVARAASTGTNALITVQGSGASLDNGDFVTSSSGGLDTYYRYFIEVPFIEGPPGLIRLVVEIDDADVGRGGAAEAASGRDRDRGGYDTSVSYTLIRPDGSSAAILNNCDTDTCSDNAW